jgi:hypothetical protein
MVSSVGLKADEQVRSSPAGSYAAPGKISYLPGLVLFVLAIALYYPVKTHPFVNYDDNIYVIDNDQVQNGLTWDTARWAFSTYAGGNWHPLTWLSHAADVQLFDLNPGRHHQTSMLLHALNAALLFWVLVRATGCAGRSFMVAALFAVHPINVESVVWIAERKTVLSMTFFLLALGAYGWFAAKPKIGRYAVVAVLFALGLMAKPQIITFPCVLLLWDYWPLRRLARRQNAAARFSLFAVRQRFHSSFSDEERRAKGEGRPSNEWRWLLLEKIPLFAIAALSAVMTMKAQRAAGAILSLDVTPLSIRLSNAVVSYVKYLMRAFWPARLAPMYPHPGSTLRAWQVYGAVLVLLVVTMLVVEHRRRGYLVVGWLWFLGTLVPMIGLVQVGRQAMADRYAYLPLIGIFIMVCWGVADLVAERTSQPARLGSKVLTSACVIVLLALMVVARRQIAYWADNVSLWTHTVQVTGPNYVAQDDLGGALMTENRMEEAIGHFRAAAAIHPVDPISAFNIGFYDQVHGNLSGAIEQYQRAIILTTNPAVKIKAWNDMGRAYRALGNDGQARACFAEARKLEAQ